MDYKLIDSGNGRRLEKFGRFTLDRPDPEVMWNKSLTDEDWMKVDAIFNDRWIFKNKIPEKWQLDIDNIKVNLKLTPFKHVGIFPEQLPQWRLINKLCKNRLKLKNQAPHVLNLFGYTGIASLFALEAGAKITHVDASKPAITWFKENQKLSGLSNMSARIFIDDALKFTAREIKRGVKYDGVIMDPPVYGHGPHGEKWSFVKSFPELLENINKILNPDPMFVIVNAYAVSTSSTSLSNILKDKLDNFSGELNSGELSLTDGSGRLLSTGIYAIYKEK